MKSEQPNDFCPGQAVIVTGTAHENGLAIGDLCRVVSGRLKGGLYAVSPVYDRSLISYYPMPEGCLRGVSIDELGGWEATIRERERFIELAKTKAAIDK